MDNKKEFISDLVANGLITTGLAGVAVLALTPVIGTMYIYKRLKRTKSISKGEGNNNEL